ncbi:MAG TPA: hypothetical protein VF736_04295 [Pyrinomonadaceae bacterium]|jgi:hypothetical protein
MHDRQRKRCERAQRVDVFMDAAAADFPLTSKGGVLAALLKQSLTQISALEVERVANAGKRRQGTEGREAARNALRQMVKLAWDTYNTITLDRPDIKGLFAPPGKSNSDQALVATARAYADTAATLGTLFTEYKLPSSVFDNMRAEADNLEARIAQQNAGGGAGINATASVEQILREIDKTVERLDTLVTNSYHDNPARLAEWESARRVESAPHPKPEQGNNAPPPPPANA